MNNNKLKEFQQATVDSVINKFYNQKQNRVLVADEVGMGKTLIASGVLEKVYEIEKKKGKKIVTAVYVCSNQNIANQNIQKLSSTGINSADRLSVQSLNFFEQKKSLEQTENYKQLIALTPDTSLKLTGSVGTRWERALICAVLIEFNELKKFKKQLIELLAGYAKVENFKDDVKWRKKNFQKEYIDIMHDKLKEKGIIEYLINVLQDGQAKKSKIIRNLRIAFSEISLEELNPDIVILDEFQRFKDLIEPRKDKKETDILTEKFFNMKNLKILLLSATPFKLYATQEEIDENGEDKDQYYLEFLNLMKFLFEYKEGEKNEKYENFKKRWDEHSNNLKYKRYEELEESKKKAEDQMYKAIVRTERISKLKENIINRIEENEYDIESFFQINDIANDIKNENESAEFRVDYVKSCPYLLSFMNYKLKRKFDQYYKGNLKKIKELKNKNWYKNEQLLWLDYNKLNNYKYDEKDSIAGTNSKLSAIKDVIFNEKENAHNNGKNVEIEKLLWVPPIKNYYNFEYPYNAEDIHKVSKTLIFSAWEMVPRMISITMSYEEERKTICKALKNNNSQAKYFKATDEDLYTSQRLRYKSINLFGLLYPSKTLSTLFPVIEILNEYEKTENKRSFNKKMREEIRKKLKKYFSKINVDEKNSSNDSWYYLFPLVLDYEMNEGETVDNWLNEMEDLSKDENLKRTEMQESIKRIRNEYERYKKGNYKFGKIPQDFDEITEALIDIIIASPANCAYRNLKSISHSTRLAQNFISLFNSQEAMAIVDLCFPNKRMEYWKKVIKYCYAGNLQATLDEYLYMLEELNCINDEIDKNEKLLELVNDAMNINVTNFYVETIDKSKYKRTPIVRKGMRTHYAVSFSRQATGDENASNRKESIRNAFNSPFWPFVLSTTSIGQEGLDFHYYCSRIVHWNLPHNPIDLEQREGRINRFKCLAIRKDVAKNNHVTEFKNNIWEEMFESIEKTEGGLVPYWSLPDKKEIDIERIIPLYNFSQDNGRYERMKNILALYRLTLGQEKQEELLKSFYNDDFNEEKKKEYEKLFINLSPYFRGFLKI